MLDNFKKFLQEFKTTGYWEAMEKEVENSPWHREANVARHTLMALEHYALNIAHYRQEWEQNVTMLALLFHDTGKPVAKTLKHSEERGDYYVYSGHELASARIFEDYVASNWETFVKYFDLIPDDFFTITWMIENHLPYGMKKPQKIQSFVNMLNSYAFDHGTWTQAYFDMLESDCLGRISDNHEEKIAKVRAFIEQMKEVKATFDTTLCGAPRLYINIGASGSGKSTLTEELKVCGAGAEVFSLDTERVEFAKSQGVIHNDPVEQYSLAWKHCIDPENEPHFNMWIQNKFVGLVKESRNIILDNTNVSRKSRAFYITMAKQHGYKVIANWFPITRQTLIDRSKARADKKVPLLSIMSQYERISMPSIGGEVHEVNVIMTNIREGKQKCC